MLINVSIGLELSSCASPLLLKGKFCQSNWYRKFGCINLLRMPVVIEGHGVVASGHVLVVKVVSVDRRRRSDEVATESDALGQRKFLLFVNFNRKRP